MMSLQSFSVQLRPQSFNTNENDCKRNNEANTQLQVTQISASSNISCGGSINTDMALGCV